MVKQLVEVAEEATILNMYITPDMIFYVVKEDKYFIVDDTVLNSLNAVTKSIAILNGSGALVEIAIPIAAMVAGLDPKFAPVSPDSQADEAKPKAKTSKKQTKKDA